MAVVERMAAAVEAVEAVETMEAVGAVEMEISRRRSVRLASWWARSRRGWRSCRRRRERAWGGTRGAREGRVRGA